MGAITSSNSISSFFYFLLLLRFKVNRNMIANEAVEKVKYDNLVGTQTSSVANKATLAHSLVA